MRRGNNAKMVAGPITVVQMLPDLDGGGVERGTLEIGGFLAARGHKSIVISSGGRMVKQLIEEGSRHIAWQVGKKSPMTLRYLLPLRRLLLKEKVDILHVRSRVPAWLGYLAWKSLPKKSRPRLVTTFHGFYSINGYSAVMAKGEKVIAISKTVAAHIREHYDVPEGRTALIYRGFDDEKFDPGRVSQKKIDALRTHWGIHKDPQPIIMLPARLTRLKGHDVFFQALKKVQSLPWTAVCVGDTEENPAQTERLMKMLKQLGLEKRVKMVGHCDNMPTAYMVAGLIVSATSTEPEAFGRVAVEAMAMGKPVIASAHGGSLETVLDKKTGWLTAPNNPDSLAAALEDAVQNQELRVRIGANGRQWVREQFTTESMCEKTLALYQELLQKANK